MHHARLILLGLLAVIALVLNQDTASPTHAATSLTVNSTADPGDGVCDATECTLREAIDTANASVGTDTIAFSIAGAGPHTIQPSSALPTVTDPVIIDGYTQPGASPNTNPPRLGSNAVLKIELDGSATAFYANGLRITGGSSTVRGLAINRFRYGSNAISLESNGGNVIEGNFIGTDVTGTAILGLNCPVGQCGYRGVHILHAPNNAIGGASAEARNIISGFESVNVHIIGSAATGNVVQGNFIGSDVTGAAALANHIGVYIVNGASNNTIGGTMAGAGNVISGNGYRGVAMYRSDTTGNVVQGNFIGTDVTGTAPLSNGCGVYIYNATSNTIGGTAAGARNVIAFNDGDGVSVSGGTANTIRGNSIHTNTGKGIANVNGGNTELAPPVITAAGSVSGTACASCTIDVYSDDADEGRIYHDSTVADAGGNWSFPGGVVGPNVTATATDGDGNTSEFSLPFACTDTDGDGVCDSGDPTPLGVCAGLAVTIRGTPGNDNLPGTPGPDVIHGLAGNDTISGLDGDDVICGGPGNDTLIGDDGANVLEGRNGNDRLEGRYGNDTLRGGRGWDAVRGGRGWDILKGDRGNDTLVGDRGNDTLEGGDGNDKLYGNPHNDKLYGGPGYDVLKGGTGNDMLNGGAGIDICDGGPGTDSKSKCEA